MNLRAVLIAAAATMSLLIGTVLLFQAPALLSCVIANVLLCAIAQMRRLQPRLSLLLPALLVAIALPITSNLAVFAAPFIIFIAVRSAGFSCVAPLITGSTLAAVGAISQAVDTSFSDGSVFTTWARLAILGTALGLCAARQTHPVSPTSRPEIYALGLAVLSCASIVFGWPHATGVDDALSGYATSTGLRPPGWANSPNEFAGILCIWLVVTISYSLYYPGRKRASAAAAILIAMMLIYTQTRGALISAAVACLLLALAGMVRPSLPTTRRRGTIVAVTITASIAVLLVTGLGGRDLLGLQQDGSAIYRRAVVARLWERIVAGEPDFIGAGFIVGNTVRPNALFDGLSVVDGSLYYTLAALGWAGTVIILAALLTAVCLAARLSFTRVVLLVSFLIVSIFENSVAWPLYLANFCLASIMIGANRETPTGYKQRAIPSQVWFHQPSTPLEGSRSERLVG